MPHERTGLLSWARARARSLHAIAWRDEAIRRLEAERDSIGTPEADVPSFFRHAYADRRIKAHMADRNYPDRGNLVARKLKAYSFAQSHGLRIPTLHGLWDSPEAIAWDELPDRVVIKSHTGASSRGVFPLRRVSDHWTMVTKSDPITPREVVDRLRRLADDGLAGGPFFAEELLDGDQDGTLPTETRVFAFYGEVGLVNVRKPSEHGNRRGTAVRRFLPDGTDGPRHPSHDDGIELPEIFDEFIDTAKRLSLSIPMPFIRIDMYDIAGQIVFGELTPRPGGSQDLGAETDLRMGELWERAQARVLNDVIDGGDYRLRFGPGPQKLQIGDAGFYLPDQGWSSP